MTEENQPRKRPSFHQMYSTGSSGVARRTSKRKQAAKRQKESEATQAASKRKPSPSSKQPETAAPPTTKSKLQQASGTKRRPPAGANSRSSDASAIQARRAQRVAVVRRSSGAPSPFRPKKSTANTIDHLFDNRDKRNKDKITNPWRERRKNLILRLGKDLVDRIVRPKNLADFNYPVTDIDDTERSEQAWKSPEELEKAHSWMQARRRSPADSACRK